MQLIKSRSGKYIVVKIAAVCIVFILLYLKNLNMILHADYAWAYSFSHYLRQGFVPYRDYSMPVPLFAAWVLSLPLYMSDSIYMWAAISASVILIIFFLNYKIVSCFDISKFFALIICTYSAFMFASSNLSYNSIVHILMLLILYILLKGNLNIQTCALLGMLSSFAVLSKQSSGLYVALTCMICMLAVPKHRRRNFFVFCLVGVLSAAPFIVYLYVNGAIADAFDIWFGVTGFTIHSNIVLTLIWCVLSSLPVIGIVLYHTWNSADFHKYMLLSIFSFCALLQLYPLPNSAHVLWSFSLPLLLSGCFIIRLFKECPHALYSFKAFIIILPYILTFMTCTANLQLVDNTGQRGLNLVDTLDLDTVNQYIYSDPDHKYLFIDENSTGAHILHDIENNNKTVTFYKYFDLLLEGNIGSKNAKELAENADCDYFIIRADKDLFFWQYSDELKDYLYSLPAKDTISIDGIPRYIVVNHH